MRSQDSKELLAPLEDVWSFLSEPHNFSDWWPGIGGVQPDRRGFAEGARWTLFRGSEPGLLQRPNAPQMLVVTGLEPYKRFVFNLPRERMDAELLLEPVGHDHTLADLTVVGPFMWGWSQRSLARRVLERLHDLLQTAEP